MKPRKTGNRFELRLDDILFDYVAFAAKQEGIGATEFVRSLIRSHRQQNQPKPRPSERLN